MKSDAHPTGATTLPSEIPQGLDPPVILGGTVQTFDVWQGNTALRRNGTEEIGEARVFLDLMPTPEFRFEFSPASKRPLVRRGPTLGDVSLDCGPPIGAVSCDVMRSSDSDEGYVNGQIDVDASKPQFTSAQFLILNGPVVYGTPITRGGGVFAGRLTAQVRSAVITLDLLSSRKQARRNIYHPTHTALCEFSEPASLSQVDQLTTDLFRTLSLMKCRWVGLVGPWLKSDGGAPIAFRVAATKTTRSSGDASWCREEMHDCFSELAPAMAAAFANEGRAEALQTALHWLVESEQCAGGVEGAIILQQAALECLAWLEIVVERRLCSTSGFKILPASDKIRWLLSLHRIPATIPDNAPTLGSYAKEFGHADLIDVLVDARNALVHAEPNKAARLFKRFRGDEERGELWYQVGGILHEAFLASVGYKGSLLRRDLTVEFAGSAIRPVPWAPGATS